VLRPLLAVPRDRLLATLREAGLPYIDDPSNADDRFERVRVREMRRLGGPLGLTAAALARTAARMEGARQALDMLAARLVGEAVTVHLETVFDINVDRVAREPHEVRIRLLREVLRRAGGERRQAELSSVEDVARRLWLGGSSGPVSVTLGRCRLERGAIGKSDRGRLLVYRETGRKPGLPTLTLPPGGADLWDDRLWVSVAPSQSGTVEVGPLGETVFRLADAHKCLTNLPVPLRTLSALPAFRQHGRTLAVPMLAAFARQSGDFLAACALAGPRVVTGEDAQSRAQPAFRARRSALLTGDDVDEA
jgi:tRNA(Ile)-lysidine synthase